MSAGPELHRNVHRRPDTQQPAPASGRSFVGSTAMFANMHEEVARQRHREVCLEAHRRRLARAVRAELRARRAVERAVRAGERAADQSSLQAALVSR